MPKWVEQKRTVTIARIFVNVPHVFTCSVRNNFIGRNVGVALFSLWLQWEMHVHTVAAGSEVNGTQRPLLSDIRMAQNLPCDAGTYNVTVLKAMALKHCEWTNRVLLDESFSSWCNDYKQVAKRVVNNHNFDFSILKKIRNRVRV
jgi:hypothetical protein